MTWSWQSEEAGTPAGLAEADFYSDEHQVFLHVTLSPGAPPSDANTTSVFEKMVNALVSSGDFRNLGGIRYNQTRYQEDPPA